MKWDSELDTAILEAGCRMFPFKGKKRGSGEVRYFIHVHIRMKSKDLVLQTIEAGNFPDLLLQFHDVLKNPVAPWAALRMNHAVDASVVNAADSNIRKVEPLDDSEFKKLADVCRSMEENATKK